MRAKTIGPVSVPVLSIFYRKFTSENGRAPMVHFAPLERTVQTDWCNWIDYSGLLLYYVPVNNYGYVNKFFFVSTTSFYFLQANCGHSRDGKKKRLLSHGLLVCLILYNTVNNFSAMSERVKRVPPGLNQHILTKN